MNTERKVKTVLYHYSSSCEYLGYSDGDVIKVLTSNESSDGYIVQIPTKVNGGSTHVRATQDGSSPFQVLEFHEEEPEESPNTPYATIADVERMIREAMGKSEKLKAYTHAEFQVMNEIVALVLNWDMSINRNNDDLVLRERFIERLLSQYTITRK